MSEVITILSGAEASYARSPLAIPTASFTILDHEGLVTLTVHGISIGDNYARYAMIRVDGTELKGYRQWVVSKSFSITAQLDLSPGEHVLEVEVTSYVGYWEVSATAEYTPNIPPPLPEDINILPAIILTGLGIVTIVGTWFLTDGFTNLPDPSQFFSGIQLPELNLPF